MKFDAQSRFWLMHVPIGIFVIGIVLSLFIPNRANPLITLLAALLTYFYVILTWRMVHGTVEQQWRPWIFINIRPAVTETSGRFSNRRVFLYFQIKNYGRVPALNLSLKCNPEVDVEDGPLSRDWSVFGPDHQEEFEIKGIDGDPEDRRFTVRIEYQWFGQNEKYSTEIPVTLQQTDTLRRCIDRAIEEASRQ